MFKFSVTIPSMIGDQVDTNAQADQTDKAMALFSDLFDGTTAHNAIGAWKDDTGKLVLESVVVVEAYADSDSNAQAVRDFAAKLQHDMRQDCVAVVVEKVSGGMEFIDERKADAA